MRLQMKRNFWVAPILLVGPLHVAYDPLLEVSG